MLKKILVPVGFTKHSKGILQLAYDLAKPMSAKLLIANVVHERDLEAVERIASFGYKVDGDHYIATIQKERTAKLDEYVRDLGISDDIYDFVLLAGDPTTELLKTVLKEDIDLVVMGTKVKDIKHIFIGSVAERMFRKCPVPV
ncbi:MAG: universal stress protein UspA, partial [Desulfobacterales bacterium]